MRKSCRARYLPQGAGCHSCFMDQRRKTAAGLAFSTRVAVRHDEDL